MLSLSYHFSLRRYCCLTGFFSDCRYISHTKYMVPWVHSSPNTKRNLNRFSRFCTVHGRASLYFTTGRPFPHQNCPFSWTIWTPSNTWFVGPPEFSNQTTSRSVQPFCRAHYCDRQTDRPTDHAVGWLVGV